MSITRRAIHLAQYHRKVKTRNKNKNRIAKEMNKIIKPKFTRKTFEIKRFVGFAKEVELSEYELPEEVYIKQCKEEGII